MGFTRQRVARVSRLCWLVVLVALTGVRPSLAAGTLYAITFNSPSDLYTVNPSTGATTFVGNTGASQVNGIAFDSTQKLFANANNGSFYRINHATGATTTIGGMGISPLEGDLAYNAAGDNFFGADSVHNLLYRINKNTGAGTVIGGFGTTGLEISGLSFGPGGILYALACNNSNPASLVTIDPQFGFVSSTIGLTGTSGSLAGLAYDPTINTMYLAMGPPGTPSAASLYTVDVTTGAATLIGPMGISSVSGLAVLVPEPGTAVMLFLPLLALRTVRRNATPA